MESERPFSRVVETNGEAWVCVGQLIVNQFTEGEGLIVANNLCANLNTAYEERRKAAEKDFKELLEITQSLYDDIGYDSADCKKFRKWKKARGIA